MNFTHATLRKARNCRILPRLGEGGRAAQPFATISSERKTQLTQLVLKCNDGYSCGCCGWWELMRVDDWIIWFVILTVQQNENCFFWTKLVIRHWINTSMTTERSNKLFWIVVEQIASLLNSFDSVESWISTRKQTHDSIRVDFNYVNSTLKDPQNYLKAILKPYGWLGHQSSQISHQHIHCELPREEQRDRPVMLWNTLCGWW